MSEHRPLLVPTVLAGWTIISALAMQDGMFFEEKQERQIFVGGFCYCIVVVVVVVVFLLLLPLFILCIFSNPTFW